MSDVVFLPVPDVLPALYLVPAEVAHEDAERMAEAAIARHVAEPLRTLALSALGTKVLAVAVRPLSDFSIRGPGASRDGEALDVVAFASRSTAWPGPVHEWVTRAAAASVAADLGLPVLDCFASTLLDPDDALTTLPGAPDLAGVPGGFRLADWVVAQRIGACLTTCGMRRFGLPELTVDEVPPDLHAAWTMMLMAAGAKVLEHLRCALRRAARGGEPGAFLELPAEFGVGRRDIAIGYGLPLADDERVLPVRLSVEPMVGRTLASYLVVDSPAGVRTAEHRGAVRELVTVPASASGAARRERRNQHAAAARR